MCQLHTSPCRYKGTINPDDAWCQKKIHFRRRNRRGSTAALSSPLLGRNSPSRRVGRRTVLRSNNRSQRAFCILAQKSPSISPLSWRESKTCSTARVRMFVCVQIFLVGRCQAWLTIVDREEGRSKELNKKRNRRWQKTHTCSRIRSFSGSATATFSANKHVYFTSHFSSSLNYTTTPVSLSRLRFMYAGLKCCPQQQ